MKSVKALFATLWLLPLLAQAQALDAANSKVSAVFKQMNVPVDAVFKKLAGTVSFSPSKPEQTKATLDIDVASFDLGDPMYNKEVLKPEWFDAAKHPKATFVLTGITGSANPYKAAGKLTIKGKTQDIQFPVTFKSEGNRQVFEGSVPIKRLAFDIGTGEWKDTSMVADEVTVKFKLVAAGGK